ncbi:hypothetical protein GGR54DRAFT_620502 [Hypoxylon sp. NC1633]|nr:hypothetical protein GGR54DRAFT_620502 [Hypoxylon sp. NC1633]
MDPGDGEENAGQPDQASSRPQAVETSAADIRAIRTILSAAAKKFSIEIPKELVLSVNFDSLKPTAKSYDGAATIRYQLGQLSANVPLKPYVRFRLNSILLQRDDIHRLPTFILGLLRPSHEELPEGLIKTTTWLSRNDAGREYVKLKEYGYTQDGHLCHLPDPEDDIFTINEYIFKTGGGQNKPAWKNQRFGKDWRLYFEGNQDEEHSKTQLSLALLQFQERKFKSILGYETRPALNFVQKYWGKWTSHPSQNVEHHFFGEEVVAQYHVRTLVTGLLRMSTRTKSNTWRRIDGTLNVPNDKANLSIVECRYSIGLQTTYDMDLPIFSMVTLSDKKWYVYQDDLNKSECWREANIQPWNRSTGVAAFAVRIYSLLEYWKDDWINLLEEIDTALNTDLQNILSHERLREIMLDKPDLRLSEFYFAVLQILRIASDWIKESMKHLRRLVDNMEIKYYSPNRARDGRPTFLSNSSEKQALEIQMFRQNWGSVLSRQQDIGRELLDRISKKQEEIQSLRDSLFSATSVSESTKSSQLNHYILVFTVVTIFYLPLSFVTALFALDIVKNQPNQFLSFTVTMALVAVSTYILAGTLAWAVRKPERRDKFKKAYNNIGSVFRRSDNSRGEEHKGGIEMA